MTQTPHAARHIDILLVEDNPGDAVMTQELLAESKVLNQIHVVADGVEAMRYLHRRPPHEDAPRPDMILLDLNLPRMNGQEVLQAIKTDPALKPIPVIVLTTSRAESDIEAAYFRHAAAFITKPVDLEQFARAVRAIESFWFSVVQLPPRP
jgi:two-component system response regulator